MALGPDPADDRRSVAIIGTRGYPSYYGGFETAVRKLAPYLAARGWDVTVYGRPGATVASDQDRDPRVTSRTTVGIDTKSLSTLTYGYTASVDAAVRRPDVALVMNVANGFFLPMLKRRGIPTVVNVDGIEWDRAKWGRTAKKMFVAGAKKTAESATALVYDARAIQRRWKRDFGRDGWFIPYGGDQFSGAPVPLGLKSRGYALIVARFVPENTVPEFFDAVPSIAENYPVVIIGSSGYGGELDARARQLSEHNPNVLWLGHVKDDDLLHSLWQHAGAYLHGHSVGGTNPALVQAMACGAPTVARDTEYNREVLPQGALFTPPEHDAISRAVIAVLKDQEKQAKLSAANLARAQERYSWDAVCRKYEEALLSAIDARAESLPPRSVSRDA